MRHPIVLLRRLRIGTAHAVRFAVLPLLLLLLLLSLRFGKEGVGCTAGSHNGRKSIGCTLRARLAQRFGPFLQEALE